MDGAGPRGSSHRSAKQFSNPVLLAWGPMDSKQDKKSCHFFLERVVATEFQVFLKTPIVFNFLWHIGKLDDQCQNMMSSHDVNLYGLSFRFSASNYILIWNFRNLFGWNLTLIGRFRLEPHLDWNHEKG